MEQSKIGTSELQNFQRGLSINLTVLTPVHNKFLCLEKTFNSIKQAIDSVKEFEIAWIISDNFSTDGSSKWLSQNQPKYGYQIIKPTVLLPALENFRFLTQASNSPYSILFAADDFCTKNFFSTLLSQAISNDLDGVIANTMRGVDPVPTPPVQRQKRLVIRDVLRLTGDSVEGIYSMYRTNLLEQSLMNLPSSNSSYGFDRVVWARLFIGNKTEQQEDISEFRYKTTFDDPTKHTSSTLSNPNPVKRAIKTLALQRKILRSLISNEKITKGMKLHNLILVSPIHFAEILDSVLPTRLRILTRNILSSCISAYASIRKTDV